MCLLESHIEGQRLSNWLIGTCQPFTSTSPMCIPIPTHSSYPHPSIPSMSWQTKYISNSSTYMRAEYTTSPLLPNQEHPSMASICQNHPVPFQCNNKTPWCIYTQSIISNAHGRSFSMRPRLLQHLLRPRLLLPPLLLTLIQPLPHLLLLHPLQILLIHLLLR